jgi:hypothetical protein
MKHIKSAGKRIFLFWYTNKMYMISHKTVSPYIQRVLFAVIFKPFKILNIVVIFLKYRLSVIASLGNMMWIPLYYNSCYSWHTKNLHYRILNVNNKIGAVPSIKKLLQLIHRIPQHGAIKDLALLDLIVLTKLYAVLIKLLSLEFRTRK